MRSLPALIKPGIKLGDEYYVTDGQFVRDAAMLCTALSSAACSAARLRITRNGTVVKRL